MGTLSTRGGVNPSSLIEPKFTGSSNHPEMDPPYHPIPLIPGSLLLLLAESVNYRVSILTGTPLKVWQVNSDT